MYEQLRSQIAGHILMGTLRNDQRLPTVRQLAAGLRIAPETVARAYSELESDGLIETRGRAGIRVSRQAETYPDVLDAAIDFANTARHANLTLDQSLLAIRAAWDA